jgi:hypothetical protein
MCTHLVGGREQGNSHEVLNDRMRDGLACRSRAGEARRSACRVTAAGTWKAETVDSNSDCAFWTPVCSTRHLGESGSSPDAPTASRQRGQHHLHGARRSLREGQPKKCELAGVKRASGTARMRVSHKGKPTSVSATHIAKGICGSLWIPMVRVLFPALSERIHGRQTGEGEA